MAKDRDNYISVFSWMLILFLTALPCVGIVVVILGAFLGSNETRKNYFRAVIIWAVLLFLLWLCLAALGLAPQIIQAIHNLLQQQPQSPQKPGTV
jgi:hypothetical protein